MPCAAASPGFSQDVSKFAAAVVPVVEDVEEFEALKERVIPLLNVSGWLAGRVMDVRARLLARWRALLVRLPEPVLRLISL